MQKGIRYWKALRANRTGCPGILSLGGLVPIASGATPSHRPWTSARARPLADNLNLAGLSHSVVSRSHDK